MSDTLHELTHSLSTKLLANEFIEGLSVSEKILQIDPNHVDGLYAKAFALRKLCKFEAAQAAVDQALSILPKSPQLLNERAFISYDRGDWQKALAGLQATLAEDAQNEIALGWTVICYRKLRDVEAAGRAMRDAMTALPSSGVVYFTGGLFFLEEGNLAKAKDAFETAAKLRSDWHEPVFKLAEVLVRSGRRSEALSRLEKRRDEFLADPAIVEQLGLIHIDANDFTSARKEFQSILAVEPENEIAKNGLGTVMLRSGRFREAAEMFEELVRKNPQQLVFQTNQARALTLIGKEEDLRKAWKICEEVKRIDPVNSEALACLGIIHYKLGNWRESEECLLQAIELNPTKGPYHRDLGALYAKQGRNEEAMEQLTIAIEIDKFDTRAYIEIGSLYFEMDRKSDAIGMLRRAVATNRNSAEAIQALAQGLIREKELSEAEQQLRDGIKRLDPRDCFGLHVALARLLTQLASNAGDEILLQEALQHSTKAVKLKPNDPHGYFEQGMAHNALNSPARALRCFNVCLQYEPDHLEAQRNIERLKKLLSMERTARRSETAGLAISAVSLVLLLALWVLFLLQPVVPKPVSKVVAVTTKGQTAQAGQSNLVSKAADVLAKQQNAESGQEPSFAPKIDKSMILTFTLMLLGLTIIGVVLPWVARLKLPGLEAELQQARVSIGAGPSGETGSGALGGRAALSASGGGSIDTGPR